MRGRSVARKCRKAKARRKTVKNNQSGRHKLQTNNIGIYSFIFKLLPIFSRLILKSHNKAVFNRINVEYMIIFCYNRNI